MDRSSGMPGQSTPNTAHPWMELARRMLAAGRPVSLGILSLDQFDKLPPDCWESIQLELQRRIPGLGEEVYLTAQPEGAFLLVLPEFDLEQGRASMERLRREVEARPFPVPHRKALPLTVSIGLVAALTPGVLEGMLHGAGQALKEARAQGGNQVCLGEPSVRDSLELTNEELAQKRRNSRTRCQIPAVVRCSGQDFPAEILDVGIGGLRMALASQFPPDSEVEVLLRDTPSHAVRALVKWSDGSQVGLRFCNSLEELRVSWVSGLLRQLGRNAESARERRSHARLEVAHKVSLTAQVGTYQAVLKNLGLGGLCAESPLVPPVGTAGQLEVSGLKVHVRVLWIAPPRFGVKFLPLSEQQREDLQRLLKDWKRRSY